MEEVRGRNLPNLTLLVVGKPITFLCDSGTTYTVITKEDGGHIPLSKTTSWCVRSCVP